VANTLNTSSSVVLEASCVHNLAVTVFSDEVAAFAGVASIVIVGFAAGNDALIVFEFEGLEALNAGVIGLF